MSNEPVTDGSDRDEAPEEQVKRSVSLGSALEGLVDGLQLGTMVGNILNNGINRALVAFNRDIENFTKSMLSATQPFVELARLFDDFAEHYGITEAEAVRILKKYKWVVSPSMPLNFVFAVVEKGRQEGNQSGAINHLYRDYFAANDYEELTALVDRWAPNPLFVARMKILRDCVAVIKHAAGHYNASNVVLPTVIAQIDGILLGYYDREEIPRNEGKKNLRKLTAEYYPQQSELVNDLLLGILFQKSIPNKPLDVPFTFSRHKIMHGEYTNYGRIDNTFRAFLILDFLHYLSSESAST